MGTGGMRVSRERIAASGGGLHRRMEGMPLGLAGAVHTREKGSGLLGLRNEPEFGLKMSLKMSLKKNRSNKIK